MNLIKGTTVVLYDRIQTGVDGFNASVYQETPVTVENILICPVNTDDIVTDIQMQGKRQEYELCIPKKDTHIWEDRKVGFFGSLWQTFGFVQTWPEENTPGPWNRKIKVKRYG